MADLISDDGEWMHKVNTVHICISDCGGCFPPSLLPFFLTTG